MTRPTSALVGLTALLLLGGCSATPAQPTATTTPAAATSAQPVATSVGSSTTSTPDVTPTPDGVTSATPAPAAASPSGASGAPREDAVLAAFRAAVRAQSDQMRDTSTIPSADLKATHDSAALTFYSNLAEDLKARGYHLTGQYKVVSASVLTVGELEAQVAACIDYADHGMVDRDGKPLTRKQKRYDKGTYVLRSWNGGPWKLNATLPGSGPSDSC